MPDIYCDFISIITSAPPQIIRHYYTPEAGDLALKSNPAPPYSGYVVLAKPPTPSGLSFLIYEMGIIMLPAGPRAQHTVGAQGLLAQLQPAPSACPTTPLSGTPLSNSKMIYTSEDKSIQYTARDIFNLSQGLGYKVQRPLSAGRSILISIWAAEARLFLPFSFHSLKTVLQIKFHLAGGAGRPTGAVGVCGRRRSGPVGSQIFGGGMECRGQGAL